MGEFEVGDKVRILDRNGSGLDEGDVYLVDHLDSRGIVVVKDPTNGSEFYFTDDCLELAGEKVKKYKIKTELCASEIEALVRLLWDTSGFEDLYNKVQKLDAKLKRKVVVVGDKEYYEDELQTALANIKPINL